ncbi:hypothetical protein HF086_015982 [Spodoptera exigua]|uniref:Uncharacterized protein n=1 Tax=Spodoptera exigua TaxID=7107 RepID=A0A922MA22_SPOEX|nr:hypothetical protein HF086_015982 [Spodoptera exigua]
MIKFSVFVCCLYFCALTPYLASAMTAEQKALIHEHFEAIGKSCNKDSHIITADDIADLRARKIPSGPNAPCFLACMMKEIGVVINTESVSDGAAGCERAMLAYKCMTENASKVRILITDVGNCVLCVIYTSISALTFKK